MRFTCTAGFGLGLGLLGFGLVLIGDSAQAEPMAFGGGEAAPVELDGSVRAGYFSASRSLDGARDLVSSSVWLKAKSRLLGGALIVDGWARHDHSLRPQNGSGAGVLREAYFEFGNGKLDLRIGKQIIAWGRADEINPTDNLTPRDYTLLTPENSDQRLGLLAVKATGQFGEFSVTACLMPGFRPSVFPLAAPPGVAFTTEEASHTVQHAFKIERTGGAVDGSVSYYSGRDLNPDLAVSSVGPAGLNLILTAPRVRVIGFDAAAAIGPLNVRTEAAYTLPVARAGNDPLVKKPHLYAVIGGDMDAWPHTNVNLQYIVRHVDDYQDPRAIADPARRALAIQQAVFASQLDRFQHGVSLRLARRWLNDTLQAEILGVVSLTTRDFVVRPKLIYAISDRWKSTLGVDIFRGGTETYFGRLRKLSAAYAELKYGF